MPFLDRDYFAGAKGAMARYHRFNESSSREMSHWRTGSTVTWSGKVGCSAMWKAPEWADSISFATSIIDSRYAQYFNKAYQGTFERGLVFHCAQRLTEAYLLMNNERPDPGDLLMVGTDYPCRMYLPGEVDIIQIDVRSSNIGRGCAASHALVGDEPGMPPNITVSEAWGCHGQDEGVMAGNRRQVDG